MWARATVQRSLTSRTGTFAAIARTETREPAARARQAIESVVARTASRLASRVAPVNANEVAGRLRAGITEAEATRLKGASEVGLRAVVEDYAEYIQQLTECVAKAR